MKLAFIVQRYGRDILGGAETLARQIAEHGRYELLVFFTYLYYPTYYGIRIAPRKSVLVPTAHDEPPLKLEIYKEVFERSGSLMFNTESEELLVLDRFDVYKKMRETIGIGMEQLDLPDAAAVRRRRNLPGRFLLYAGRIDEGKGCGELIRFFRYYKEERPAAGNLHLLFMGNLSMKLPSARDIRYLGFLGEEEKLEIMAAASALVISSRLESLSIVALEAFSVGTPVLVSAGSKVLVEHCRKSNAGLYYSDYNDFEGILDLLADDKTLLRGMGKLGKRYIKENFGWEKLLDRYELAFRSSARPPRPAPQPKKPERIRRDQADEQPSESEQSEEEQTVGEEPVDRESEEVVASPGVPEGTPSADVSSTLNELAEAEVRSENRPEEALTSDTTEAEEPPAPSPILTTPAAIQNKEDNSGERGKAEEKQSSEGDSSERAVKPGSAPED